MSDGPWYQTFFDERYLRFFPVLEREPVALEEAQAVQRLLQLEPGQRVLDLGCGTGRHSVALARLGFEVTGLDLSPDLLAQAQETAAAEQVEVSWLQRDMRELDDLDPFDACVSLYTAFGFFGDEENEEVLRQIAAALKPGGRLLLDLTNHLGYLRRFPREVWRETELAVTRERNHYDPLGGVLITERTAFLHDGGRLELPASRVRAYLPHEVLGMLRRAGLQLVRMHGALSEQVPFSWAESPNQVYLCQRG